MPPPGSAPPRTLVPLCQLAVRRAPRPFLNRPALEFELVARLAAAARAGGAAEEVELGNAGADQHRIGEMPGMVEGELEPSGAAAAPAAEAAAPAAEAAAAAAEAAASAAAAAPAALAARPALASGARRRRLTLGGLALARAGSRSSGRSGRTGSPLPAPPEASAALAGLRLRSDRKAEVEAPAQLRALGAGEIDRPRVDEQQPPVGVALEALREGGLDLGRRRREAGNGVDDPAGRVIGAERQVLLGERPDRRSELPHPPVVGDQSGIAAVDPGHLDRLAADEVEHPDARASAAPGRRAAASRARRPRR